MEVKDNMKNDAAHINNLATSKIEPDNYDSNISVRVPHKKKTRAGVLTSRYHNEKCQSITELSAVA